MQSSKYFAILASKFYENCPFYASASLLNFRLKWPNDIYTENGIKIGGKELFLLSTIEVQFPLGLATLGLATILDLVIRNSGFLDNQHINSTLGLATYIGFSDLNRVENENWSLNPVGTVLSFKTTGNESIF